MPPNPPGDPPGRLVACGQPPGSGAKPRLPARGGGQRGDGRGQVPPDECDRGAGRPAPSGGVPAGDGGAKLPPGEVGGGADALRGPAVRGALSAPNAGVGRVALLPPEM